MAKKRKNRQKNDVLVFPDEMPVTPELQSVIDTIKNPFTFSYFVDLFCLIGGIWMIYAGLRYTTGLISIYFCVFGAFGILYGAVNGWVSFRKDAAFKKFIKKKAHRIIWVYPETYYEAFYKDLKQTSSGVHKERIGWLCGGIILLTVVLFFTMKPEQRWMALPFGAVCLGVILLTVVVMPRQLVKAAGRKPYISIIDDHEAYALGRFHTWKKGLVRFRELPRHFDMDAYEMLISYQEKGLSGMKTPTFQVLLPDDDPRTLQFARREGSRINKERKALQDGPAQGEDFLDKAFKKMIGQDDTRG